MTKILNSNGGDVPDFCDDEGGIIQGVCTNKTVQDYFNYLKPVMLSSYYAELECTAAPTAAP